MNNEIVNAMEELENWLADPSELGRKPAKIEYTASFEDEDGIKCMIFKLKKYLFLLLCLWNIQQRFRQISHLS